MKFVLFLQEGFDELDIALSRLGAVCSGIKLVTTHWVVRHQCSVPQKLVKVQVVTGFVGHERVNI